MKIGRNAAYAGLVLGVTIFFALRAFLSYGQGPGVYGAAEADGVLRSFFAGVAYPVGGRVLVPGLAAHGRGCAGHLCRGDGAEPWTLGRPGGSTSRVIGKSVAKDMHRCDGDCDRLDPFCIGCMLRGRSRPRCADWGGSTGDHCA